MDNKRIFAASFIFFILLFLIPPVSASTTTLTITVKISGTDDYDGSAIEDASIYIAGTYVGETDSDGEYEYTHSKSEKFRVTIKKDGYDYMDRYGVIHQNFTGR